MFYHTRFISNKMKNIVKFSLTLILIALFIYESSKTVRKFLAKKTSLQVYTIHYTDISKVYFLILNIYHPQVTMTDDGHILFPSITICKDEMYDHFSGLMAQLQSGELSVKNSSSWFREGFNNLQSHDHNEFDFCNKIKRM